MSHNVMISQKLFINKNGGDRIPPSQYEGNRFNNVVVAVIKPALLTRLRNVIMCDAFYT